jgi:hypothetical protein
MKAAKRFAYGKSSRRMPRVFAMKFPGTSMATTSQVSASMGKA